MNTEHSTSDASKTFGKRKGCRTLPKHLEITHPNAAGIDVGGQKHFVAVPADRAEQAVRSFGPFTTDLEAMAQWLAACGVDTVALESTGIYWIPVFRVLESHGIEVCLVNARHVKYVPGRKTDVLDCQWLQKLHTYGLLSSSFVPQADIHALRVYWRQRKQLVQSCSRTVLHMHKALTQMNLHLHVVISDITGATGIKILRAIVAGERDPEVLARHRDPRIRASHGDIVKALTGHYRGEHVFCLAQALELYDMYRAKIADCDRQLHVCLADFESKICAHDIPDTPPKKNKLKRRKDEPDFDLRSEAFRMTGVDLTQIDGIDAMTAMTIISECGPDLAQFPTEKHFASWLGLCPDNAITGGRVRKRRTKHVINRAADALRMAASTLHRSHSYLGALYRRKRAKLGAPKAITALAHKLARLVYALIKHGHAYLDKGQEHEEALYQERKQRGLIKQAKQMGYLVVNQQTGEVVS